jgi:hypothetical protein
MTKQLKVGDKFSWGKAFPTFTVVAVSRLGRALNLKNDAYRRGHTPVVGSQLVLVSETYHFENHNEDYFRVIILGENSHECLYQSYYKLLSAARKYYLTLKTKGKAE